MDLIQKKTDYVASRMKELMETMVEQYQAKNVAYGDSFGKQYEKYGPVSALVRMSDKFSRIESLIMGAENKVKDERLEDSLIDLATYCLMTVLEESIKKIPEEELIKYYKHCEDVEVRVPQFPELKDLARPSNDVIYSSIRKAHNSDKEGSSNG